MFLSEHLLPAFPQVPNYHLACYSTPASTIPSFDCIHSLYSKRTQGNQGKMSIAFLQGLLLSFSLFFNKCEI